MRNRCPRHRLRPSWVFALPLLVCWSVWAQPAAEAPFRFGPFERALTGLGLPSSAAIADDGTIFIADAADHCIAAFSRDGRRLRTFGSLGEEPGQLCAPSGVAIGSDGRVFVADTGNHRVQVFDVDGRFVLGWGERGVEPGQFCAPQGIAFSGDRVFLADTGNQRVQVFGLDGTLVTTFGMFGNKDGQFNRPVDLAVCIDAAGESRVLVVDADGNRVQAFDSNGGFIASWGDFGQFAGLLNDPRGITCVAGEVLVTDTANHRVQVFSQSGEILRQWGVHDPFAHQGEGKIHYPHDVTIAPDGSFAVLCEPNEHRCQVFRAASAGESEATRQGIPPGEQTHFGQRLAIDGRLMLIPEPENHFVYIFDLLQEAAIIISQFGTRGGKYGQFIHPSGLVVSERDRSALVADASTGRLQEFALDFQPESTIDFRPFMTKFSRAFDLAHARFARPDAAMRWPLSPAAIRRDAQGNLHVLDDRNAMIIVFNPGMRYLRAYGGYGNGIGQLREPTDLAFSPDGSVVYVVDAGNFRVHAFDAQGKPGIVFGAPGDGEGRLRRPFGVAVDREGFVYVSDALADCVQKFDASGKFVTKWGERGDRHAQFWRPMGMAIDSRERLVVIDHGNHRAQMFSRAGEWLGTFGAGRAVLKSQLAE